jgi:hypothetical protein
VGYPDESDTGWRSHRREYHFVSHLDTRFDIAMSDPIDDWYNARDREMFGKFWVGPQTFPYGEEVLVARLPKDPEDGDGYPSEIYVTAMPARFFKLVVLPSTNSINEPRFGFTLTTGSDDEMGKLVLEIAKAAAQGMIGAPNEDH